MRPVGIVRPRDLTEGSVLHNVISMGVPSMIGFATTTVCALFDIYFLGLIGSGAVAAMTLFVAFSGVLSTTNSLVGSGSVSVISRRYGERDYRGTENAIKQTLLLKFGFAVLAGGVGLLLLRWVLLWMNAEPRVAALGFEYGLWMFIGLPFNFCSWSMFTAFRGMGDARRAMYLMVLTTGLNIILAPLMMFHSLPFSLHIGAWEILRKGAGIGLGLGISGSAIAKGISLLVCCIVGLLMLRSPRMSVRFRLLKGWKPDLNVMARILKIGTPPWLEGIARSVAGFATAYFVALFGTTVVAAYGFATQILGFTVIFAVGMGLGSSAIVGHCLGAGRKQMALKTVNTAIAVAFSMCAPIAAGIFIFAPQVMSGFTADAAVVKVAIIALKIMAFSALLQSVRIVLASAFNGSGDTLPPTVIGLSAEALRLSLLAVAIYAFSASETVIWWAFIAGSVFDTLLIASWYKKGRWLERKV